MADKYKKSKQEIELETRIPIEEYFNQYVRPLKKGVREISTLQNTSICPFHDENDPSFHYWVSKKMVHCFGCGFTGNIVGLHQAVQRMYYNNNLDRLAAINDLIRLYGLQDIIKDILVEEQTNVSVFDRCRGHFVQGMTHITTPDKFTVTRFRNLNKQIMSESTSIQNKVKAFGDLDLLACLVISDNVE